MGWILRLTFFSYTLLFPSDIFETVGWWFIFIFSGLSYLLPAAGTRFL